MTMTDLPPSTSRSSRPSSCSTSARCRPLVGLVEDQDAALLRHVGGQLESLPSPPESVREWLADREAAKADVDQALEDGMGSRRARLARNEERLGLGHGHR